MPTADHVLPRALSAEAVAELQRWVGRTQAQDDTVCAAPLRGLSATLDRDDPPPSAGDVVPPLGHWLYFLPQARQSELGEDGHARRGGFLPPVPLPRRMWAGGRLAWEAANPLRVGDVAERRSRIERVTHKQGRSGDLLFVLVRHEVHNTHGLCLTEEHDIVYRAAAQAGDAAPEPISAPTHADCGRQVEADDVLLMRYSALTFNGHRIHYDRRYVTQVEGYPGLVVHGPLIATLLVDLARRQSPERTARRFAFKAVRPTFDGHAFKLQGRTAQHGDGLALWASDHDGWLTMQADLQWV